ncbi:MAG: pilus assembly protein PilM, partial [Candidatus Omnitrophota bacterium]
MLSKVLSILQENAVVGLHISEDYITATRVSTGDNGNMRLEKMGWIENLSNPLTPYGTAILIKQLWRKYRIRNRTVSFSIDSASFITKYFRYTDLSDEELESTIILEAEQIFQRPKQDLALDWHLYPNSVVSDSKEAGKIKEGVLVVVPREVIDKNLRILEIAGLYPIIMDVSSMALSSLFLRLKSDYKDKIIGLINLSSHNADINILSRGQCIYPKNLYSQVSPWEERLDDLIANIEDVLRYYQFRLGYKPVEKLIFTGIVSSSEIVRLKLKKSLRLPIEFWNPMEEISSKNAMSREEIDKYGPIMTISLGLALRRAENNGFFKLNLIKDRIQPLKKRKWLFLGMIVYLFLCQAAIFYFCYNVTSNLIILHNHKKKLDLSEKSSYVYGSKAKYPNKDILETETMMSQYIDALDKTYSALSKRKDVASILLRCSAGLPQSAYIDNFILDSAS